MLSDGLVNGFLGRQLVRQSGMFRHRHQTHAGMWVVHGTHLAPHASRHAHVHFVAQFLINAMGVGEVMMAQVLVQVLQERHAGLYYARRDSLAHTKGVSRGPRQRR